MAASSLRARRWASSRSRKIPAGPRPPGLQRRDNDARPSSRRLTAAVRGRPEDTEPAPPTGSGSSSSGRRSFHRSRRGSWDTMRSRSGAALSSKGTGTWSVRCPSAAARDPASARRAVLPAPGGAWRTASRGRACMLANSPISARAASSGPRPTKCSARPMAFPAEPARPSFRRLHCRTLPGGQPPENTETRASSRGIVRCPRTTGRSAQRRSSAESRPIHQAGTSFAVPLTTPPEQPIRRFPQAKGSASAVRIRCGRRQERGEGTARSARVGRGLPATGGRRPERQSARAPARPAGRAPRPGSGRRAARR